MRQRCKRKINKKVSPNELGALLFIFYLHLCLNDQEIVFLNLKIFFLEKSIAKNCLLFWASRGDPMARRRCVICGEEPPEKDHKGNEAYAYPKTEDEARIWQASMGAKGCCVESIQQQCCVCVEHIPEFVKRAKRVGRRIRNLERNKERRREELLAIAGAGCVCPDGDTPGPDRPTVNVLLLNGASLPTYCGKGQATENLCQAPEADGDSGMKLIKRVNGKESDTEIFVQESGFVDTGGKHPDIDGTEMTVLQAPTQDDEHLEQFHKDYLKEQKKQAKGLR